MSSFNSHALMRFTASPTTAMPMASSNRMATGSASLTALSQPISSDTIASTMALANAARSPSLPVPKVKRESRAWRRAYP
ncbi:hypothetical protein D3C87_1688750 [compost metagenome]